MRYQFHLYVVRDMANTIRALDALRRMCEELLPGQYELNVIDVLEHPHLAEEARIIATPTLVKERPLPACRLVGDLSERERVLAALGLAGPDTPGVSWPEPTARTKETI